MRKNTKLNISFTKNFIILLLCIFGIALFVNISLSYLIPDFTATTAEGKVLIKEFQKYYSVIAKLVFVGMGLSFMLILAYSLITINMIKRPLKQIDDALIKIIDSQYDEKLELDGALEFLVVSNTINYLIEKFKSTNEEKIKLKESKDAMLLDLSHDIKTPITSIRGFSQALNDGMIDNEDDKRRYYKNILNKSERVSELVDDLFEFVRMDSIEYTLKLEKVDINEYIRKIVLSYYEEIIEKGFQIQINISEDPIFIKIDTRTYKRALINLIENAIKHNKKGTSIRVEVRETKKFVIIEVGDNGKGIDKEFRAKIFDAFVRTDTSRTSAGGSGLGLAIAHKIVEKHGGEISLLNGRAGEKTIFYIKAYK